MYLISSAEIKSPSYASSSRRVLGIPPWFIHIGYRFWVGFPYRLPVVWYTEVLSGTHILLSAMSLSNNQSNPIQSISCWPSETVKFPTPPAASSQLVLATSLAQPSGPSKGMSAWVSTEHG